MENSSQAKVRLSDRHANIMLAGVIAAGLLVRFYYFPYGIPITLDGFAYFLYAMDTSVLGHLPTNYSFPNNGWPLVLSFFVSVFRFENYLDYVTLQRVLTVIFSVATVIPTYFLCKKFFSQALAIVGSAFFVLTPRVVQNSLGGITDPLFILLTTTSVALFLAESRTRVYVSFFVLALATLVRYEGLLLIMPFSILFVIRFRKESKIILRYLTVLAIFVITLTPLAYLRVEATGQDGLVSHVLGGAKVTVTSGSILEEGHTKFSLQNSLINLTKFLGAATLPILFIFIPYGIYCFFRDRNYYVGSLGLIAVFMLMPAAYAYGRDFQDARYVFIVLPIVSIVALYSVQKIASRVKKQNLVIVLVLLAMVASSMAYLEYKKADLEYEREAVRLALFIHNLDGAVSEYYPESTYVETTGLYGLKLPTSSDNVEFGPKVVSFNGQSVEEGIQVGREKGLSHLVVDNLNTKQNRKPFLNDVFYHEEKYPYLIKIFDSNEHGYNYQVKVFKIDYEKFDSILREK